MTTSKEASGLFTPEVGKAYRIADSALHSLDYSLINDKGTYFCVLGNWSKLKNCRLAYSDEPVAVEAFNRFIAHYGNERGVYLIHEDSRLFLGTINDEQYVLHITELREPTE